jgi:hypothetical protein
MCSIRALALFHAFVMMDSTKSRNLNTMGDDRSSDNLENDSPEKVLEGVLPGSLDLSVLDEIGKFLDALGASEVLSKVMDFVKPLFNAIREFIFGAPEQANEASRYVGGSLFGMIWDRIQRSFEGSIQRQVINGNGEKAQETVHALTAVAKDFQEQAGVFAEQRADLIGPLGLAASPGGALTMNISLAPLAAAGAALEARRTREIADEGKSETSTEEEEGDWFHNFTEKFLPEDFKVPEFLSEFWKAPWYAISERLGGLFEKSSKTEVLALSGAAAVLGKKVFDTFFGNEEDERNRSFLDRIKDSLWSVAKIGTLVGGLFYSRGVWMQPLRDFLSRGFDFFGLKDKFDGALNWFSGLAGSVMDKTKRKSAEVAFWFFKNTEMGKRFLIYFDHDPETAKLEDVFDWFDGEGESSAEEMLQLPKEGEEDSVEEGGGVEEATPVPEESDSEEDESLETA